MTRCTLRFAFGIAFLLGGCAEVPATVSEEKLIVAMKDKVHMRKSLCTAKIRTSENAGIRALIEGLGLKQDQVWECYLHKIPFNTLSEHRVLMLYAMRNYEAPQRILDPEVLRTHLSVYDEEAGRRMVVYPDVIRVPMLRMPLEIRALKVFVADVPIGYFAHLSLGSTIVVYGIVGDRINLTFAKLLTEIRFTALLKKHGVRVAQR